MNFLSQKKVSVEHTDYVQKARTTRALPPPPAHKPMQFVAVKPCPLYQTAHEQLKKAEEIKKVKEVKKEEPEDWQNVRQKKMEERERERF